MHYSLASQRVVLTLCAVLLSATFNLLAEPLVVSSMSVPHLKGEMNIDGKLDELQWQQAKHFTLDYVVKPYENTDPPVITQVRIFEDENNLYVSFVAQDPNPEAINAFYRDRDKVWREDLVGFKLDTFNDSRLAYQFFVNPYGVQADSIQNEMTGRESDSWDAIWQSAGKITDTGFQVEIAIPLRVLNFKEGSEEKIWGAEFVRFYPREERLRISNYPTDRNNSCNLCQLKGLKGFKQAKQGQSLALIPTFVLGRGRTREPDQSLEWEYEGNQQFGFDVAWGITPEISLQATLNPDFSQVESDVAQLSINNTNALFFAEKRPFFLANADYFSSNYNLVYTRNINSPDFGAKITGRNDQHTLGVFIANDETTSFVVPGNLESSVAELEQKSTNIALRYRYDFSKKLSVGIVSTVRDTDDYHNYVYGLDSKYQITDSDTLRVQWVGSQTQYPFELYKDFDNEVALRLQKENAFSGNAFRINYRHNQRDWHFRADHLRTGQDFRADLGFQTRVDRNTSVVGGGYRWYSEKSWWNKMEVFGDWDISHNSNGELLEEEAEVFASVRGKWQSYIELGLRKRDRAGLRQDNSNLKVDDNATLFAEDSLSFFFDIRPTSTFSLAMFSRYGDQIDFENNRLGKQLNLNPRINVNLGKHLQLNIRHTYRDFEVNGDNLFTANLTDMRLTYQLDQRQFVRLILVYSDIDRNLDNYLINIDNIDSRSRSLGTQILYSYKVNPLTKFFFGYSDSSFQDDDIGPRRAAEQSLFMKFSYAWLN